MRKGYVAAFLFAFYFPMVGKLVPVIKDLPFHFAYYGIAFLLMMIAMRIASEGKVNRLPSHARLLFVFSIYFVINLVAKGLLENQLQLLMSKAIGVLFGVTVILFLIQLKVYSSIEEWSRVLVPALGVFLCGQVVVSSIESIRGELFSDYEIKVFMQGLRAFMPLQLIEGRDILNVLGLSQYDLFGFKIPFAGLIGQHNAFGSMLVFYNLYFLADLLSSRRKVDYFFLGLTLFAALANTTRIAIIAIVISDTIALLFFVKNRTARNAIVLLTLLVLGLFGADAYMRVSQVFERTNTIVSRIDLWQYLLNRYVILTTAVPLLVGLNVKDLLQVGMDYIGRTLGSYENQFFAVFLLSGAVGLLLYIFTFFVYPIKLAARYGDHRKIIAYLVAANVLLVSMTLDTVLHYATYVLVAMLYVQYLRPLDQRSTRDSTGLYGSEIIVENNRESL